MLKLSFSYNDGIQTYVSTEMLAARARGTKQHGTAAICAARAQYEKVGVRVRVRSRSVSVIYWCFALLCLVPLGLTNLYCTKCKSARPGLRDPVCATRSARPGLRNLVCAPGLLI